MNPVTSSSQQFPPQFSDSLFVSAPTINFGPVDPIWAQQAPQVRFASSYVQQAPQVGFASSYAQQSRPLHSGPLAAIPVPPQPQFSSSLLSRDISPLSEIPSEIIWNRQREYLWVKFQYGGIVEVRRHNPRSNNRPPLCEYGIMMSLDPNAENKPVDSNENDISFLNLDFNFGQFRGDPYTSVHRNYIMLAPKTEEVLKLQRQAKQNRRS